LTPVGAISFGALLPIGRRLELSGIDAPVDKWATTVATATRAEELGYDSVWVYDHLHNVPVPSHETVFESWTALGALSQRTTRVRLGHMVGCNLLRNPALVAKMAATLDVISGGRVEWGIGTGWEEHELRAYGYDFPPPAERIGRVSEAIDIVRAMWTQPDATYDGRYYRVHGAQCDPKPLQQPHPPIWIGGAGEQLMLRVVARQADRSSFGGTPEEFAHKCAVLARHCRDAGRDVDEITKSWSHDVFVRDSEAEVDDIGSRGLWGEHPDEWRAANLVGTPEQVCERIQRYIEADCRAFVVWCADYPSHETLTLFAEKVIPEFT
jgi:F420-dependent oxidoreductase-like protein